MPRVIESASIPGGCCTELDGQYLAGNEQYFAYAGARTVHVFARNIVLNEPILMHTIDMGTVFVEAHKQKKGVQKVSVNPEQSVAAVQLVTDDELYVSSISCSSRAPALLAIGTFRHVTAIYIFDMARGSFLGVCQTSAAPVRVRWSNTIHNILSYLDSQRSVYVMQFHSDVDACTRDSILSQGGKQGSETETARTRESSLPVEYPVPPSGRSDSHSISMAATLSHESHRILECEHQPTDLQWHQFVMNQDHALDTSKANDKFECEESIVFTCSDSIHHYHCATHIHSSVQIRLNEGGTDTARPIIKRISFDPFGSDCAIASLGEGISVLVDTVDGRIYQHYVTESGHMGQFHSKTHRVSPTTLPTSRRGYTLFPVSDLIWSPEESGVLLSFSRVGPYVSKLLSTRFKHVIIYLSSFHFQQVQKFNMSNSHPFRSERLAGTQGTHEAMYLPPARGALTFAGVTNTGGQILSSTKGGSIRILDYLELTTVTQSLATHASPILCIQRHPVIPQRFATGSVDGSVRIWTTSNADAEVCDETAEVLHTSTIPDDNTWLGDQRGVACEKTLVVGTAVTCLCWGLTSSTLHIGTSDGHVLEIDIFDDTVPVNKLLLSPERPVVTSILAHCGRQRVSIATVIGTACYVCDFQSEHVDQIQLLSEPTCTAAPIRPELADILRKLKKEATKSDKQLIASGTASGDISITKIGSSSRELLRLTAHEAPVISVCWCPFAQDMLVSIDKSGHFIVWNMRTGGITTKTFSCLADADVELHWGFDMSFVIYVFVSNYTVLRIIDLRNLFMSESIDISTGRMLSCVDLHPAVPFELLSSGYDSRVSFYVLNLFPGLREKLFVDRFYDSDGQSPNQMMLISRSKETSPQSSPWLSVANCYDSFVLMGGSSYSSLNSVIQTTVQTAKGVIVQIISKESSRNSGAGTDVCLEHSKWHLPKNPLLHNHILRTSSAITRKGDEQCKSLRADFIVNVVKRSWKKMKQRERQFYLNVASFLYVTINQTENACRVLELAEDLDTALIIAPSVSPDFWRNLLQTSFKKRNTSVERLRNQFAQDIVNIIAEPNAAAIEHLRRGNLNIAITIAENWCSENGTEEKSSTTQMPFYSEGIHTSISFLHRRIHCYKAFVEYISGRPLNAATSLLKAEAVRNAALVVLYGGHVLVADALMRTVGGSKTTTKIAARKLLHCGLWDDFGSLISTSSLTDLQKAMLLGMLPVSCGAEIGCPYSQTPVELQNLIGESHADYLVIPLAAREFISSTYYDSRIHIKNHLDDNTSNGKDVTLLDEIINHSTYLVPASNLSFASSAKGSSSLPRWNSLSGLHTISHVSDSPKATAFCTHALDGFYRKWGITTREELKLKADEIMKTATQDQKEFEYKISSLITARDKELKKKSKVQNNMPETPLSTDSYRLIFYEIFTKDIWSYAYLYERLFGNIGSPEDEGLEEMHSLEEHILLSLPEPKGFILKSVPWAYDNDLDGMLAKEALPSHYLNGIVEAIQHYSAAAKYLEVVTLSLGFFESLVQVTRQLSEWLCTRFEVEQEEKCILRGQYIARLFLMEKSLTAVLRISEALDIIPIGNLADPLKQKVQCWATVITLLKACRRGWLFTASASLNKFSANVEHYDTETAFSSLEICLMVLEIITGSEVNAYCSNGKTQLCHVIEKILRMENIPVDKERIDQCIGHRKLTQYVDKVNTLRSYYSMSIPESHSFSSCRDLVPWGSNAFQYGGPFEWNFVNSWSFHDSDEYSGQFL